MNPAPRSASSRIGPPLDPNVPDQRPARYRSIAGTITDEGLIFALGGARYTFKDTADGLMWGHACARSRQTLSDRQ